MRPASVARIDIHRLHGLFANRLRPARMRMFLERFDPGANTTILDIGGTAAFWAGTDLNVTVLNTRAPSGPPSDLAHVIGDATDLAFPDSSFDIAFSNSMIEHLHTRENQERAAGEAMRVGSSLWIQTPNRWFPVEPHYLTPFIHWLPKPLRRRLVRNCTIWGLTTRPRQDEISAMVDELRLLSRRELRKLFPGCQIIGERFLGLTKSLIVVR